MKITYLLNQITYLLNQRIEVFSMRKFEKWMINYNCQKEDFLNSARDHPIVNNFIHLCIEEGLPEEWAYLFVANALIEQNRMLIKNAKGAQDVSL